MATFASTITLHPSSRCDVTPSQPAQGSARKFAEPANPIPSPFYRLLTLAFILICLFHAGDSFARTYTVKSGDTLQRIAQRELGSANRWPEIARLNNLPPPHTIRLGQQLNLPDTQTGMIPLGPMQATNSPPPAVPPGNALPPPPQDIVTSPIPSDSPSFPGIASLGWGLLFGILGFLLFYALTLRISCWFSLVETTLLRCLKLTLYELLLIILCFFGCLLIWLIAAAIGMAAKFEPWSIGVMFSVAPVVFLVWFFLSIIVIKRTLECKWRSVVTILTMSSFVTSLLWIIIALSTLSIGAIAGHFTK